MGAQRSYITCPKLHSTTAEVHGWQCDPTMCTGNVYTQLPLLRWHSLRRDSPDYNKFENDAQVVLSPLLLILFLAPLPLPLPLKALFSPNSEMSVIIMPNFHRCRNKPRVG